ncbi:hypothetical protein [Staphylococcus xylosus]|uniref:hypothetical protein n=1 Tax=Staphylococcus xylosus TaxID=1288 RepID=UPI00115E52E2|nr:hypothetical protein [Staphylococcus xylosus]
MQTYIVYFKAKSNFNGKPMYITFHSTVQAINENDATVKGVKEYKKSYCANLPFEITKILEE